MALKKTFPIPQVFQTFLVSFNEQRRPIMPLLTAMKRTPKMSEEQRALREAWDTLSEKVSSTQISCPIQTLKNYKACTVFDIGTSQQCGLV